MFSSIIEVIIEAGFDEDPVLLSGVVSALVDEDGGWRMSVGVASEEATGNCQEELKKEDE